MTFKITMYFRDLQVIFESRIRLSPTFVRLSNTKRFCITKDLKVAWFSHATFKVVLANSTPEGKIFKNNSPSQSRFPKNRNSVKVRLDLCLLEP